MSGCDRNVYMQVIFLRFRDYLDAYSIGPQLSPVMKTEPVRISETMARQSTSIKCHRPTRGSILSLKCHDSLNSSINTNIKKLMIH